MASNLRPIRVFAAFALAACAAMGAGQIRASGLQMKIMPVFPGIEPGFKPAPIAVEVENRGLGAKGELLVIADGFAMRYPVKLPSGSKQRIVTYPRSEGSFSQIRFILATNRGEEQQQMNADSYFGPDHPTKKIGVIGDKVGQLGFLTKIEKYAGQERRNVSYCKPEMAPTRPIGYMQFSSLVLAAGSERMSPEAVQAIQSWVLSGGNLMLLANAKSRVVSMPAWSNVAPVRSLEVLASGVAQKRFSAMQIPPGEIVSAFGKAVPSASDEYGGLLVARPFGLGRVSYLGIDPFSGAAVKWQWRRTTLDPELYGQYRTDDRGVVYGAMRSSAATAQISMAEQSINRPNPFRTKLPSTSTVLGILVAYFIAVVPVNFLLLRKLKRGEWAWATAPVLSVAFAGVFFYAAKDLYSTGLSSATHAFLVMQEGENEGIAMGNTQMFFPKGGLHDLKLDNVDYLSSTSDVENDSVNYRNRRAFADANATDGAEVEVDAMPVPNLAFRELFYRQRVDVSGWFAVADKGVRVVVKNHSPYLLKNAILVASDGTFGLGDIAAGESKSLDKMEIGRSPLGFRNGSPTSLQHMKQFASKTGVPLLTGKLEGMRVGPQIGKEIEQALGVTLVCTADEKLKVLKPMGGAKPWLP